MINTGTRRYVRGIHQRSYNHGIRPLHHVSCLLVLVLVMNNGKTSDLRRHQLAQLTQAYRKVLLHVELLYLGVFFNWPHYDDVTFYQTR